MKPEALLELLETAADGLGVRVSYEQLGVSVGHGGLCRVKGQPRVIIDKRATPGERVSTLAASLAQVATPEQVAALPTKAREAIDFYSPRIKRAS
jgi:hypothetical protein